MADRRMIDRAIVTEGSFLELSTNAKLLYIMLNLHADDDGFVSPAAVMKLIDVGKEDLDALIESNYIYAFDSGVVVIKDWHIHNSIRSKKGTRYATERAMLDKGSNKVYIMKKKAVGA